MSTDIITHTQIIWVKAAVSVPSSPRGLITAVSERDGHVTLRNDVTYDHNYAMWFDEAGDPVNVLWWASGLTLPQWYDTTRSQMEGK